MRRTEHLRIIQASPLLCWI